MKKETFWTWSLGLALAALPLSGSCDQASAVSAPVIASEPGPAVGSPANTNAPSPEVAEAQLENAPGQVVSVATPPANINLTASSAEVLKLAQAGVDESVMLSFVTNSAHTFNLDSDDIVYLNDSGVPGTVVTAMIQHDQAMKAAGGWAPPVYNGQSAYPPGTSAPGYGENSSSAPTEPAPPTAVVEGNPPMDQANPSADYFYDSLAPYGNWVDIGGYGLCWQPTVVAARASWRPYCDGGHWAYSDCGWYWASDYTWGWAPFHYGRWFHHRSFGWCWAPDTVWGPAWVSWRYTSSHCGWAPLPPTACFTPGVGFSYYGVPVGFSFSFGLPVVDFAFVNMNFFCDRHLEGHLIAERDVRALFNRSVMGRGVLGQNRNFINAGVPVSRIAAATHATIHRLQIRDAVGPGAGRFDRVEPNSRSLTVFRPNLPTPTHQTALVGQGIHSEAHRGNLPPIGRSPTVTSDTGRSQFGVANSSPRERTAGTVPVIRNQPAVIQRPARQLQPVISNRQTPLEQNNAAIIQGSDRRTGTPTPHAVSPAPIQNRFQEPDSRVFRQETPAFQNRAQPSFSRTPTTEWAPASRPMEQERRAVAVPETSMTPAPRAEIRQAPAATVPSAPSRAYNNGQNGNGNGNGNGRQNH